MKELQLIAQLYTVRELIYQHSYDEIFAVLKTIKDQGYEGVQISGIGNIDQEKAELFKEICETLNLSILATHLSLEYLEEHFDWVVEYHRLWNCKLIGIGSMPTNMRNFEGVCVFAEKLNQLGNRLKNYGMTLIYHNHKFEFEKYNNKTWMEHLLERFDKDVVEFELDTYWVQAGGCDPVDWIYRVDKQMSLIHFKDFRIQNDEQRFAEIGKGNLNWEHIIDACRKTDVKIIAVEQDGYTDDPLKSLEISANYLKKYLS